MSELKPKTGLWGRLTGRGAAEPETKPADPEVGLVRGGVQVDETFAEAFPMSGTALIITAPSIEWARIAATTMTGFATSVIGCGCEAGIDREFGPADRISPLAAPDFTLDVASVFA